jgi:hypothetical protein
MRGVTTVDGAGTDAATDGLWDVPARRTKCFIWARRPNANDVNTIGGSQGCYAASAGRRAAAGTPQIGMSAAPRATEICCVATREATGHRLSRMRPKWLLLSCRLQDQIRDRVGLRYEGNVTRLYLDGFRAHALCHEALEIRIDRPVFR